MLCDVASIFVVRTLIVSQAYTMVLILIDNTRIVGGLDSLVDNALACHHGDPGSNPGQCMWQGSGRPSRFGGFPRVLRFPPPRWTT